MNYGGEREATREEKDAARAAVARAIYWGKLIPGECEVGGECEGRIEAHHEDYAQPLRVRWLCRRHHREAHRGPKPPSRARRPRAKNRVEIKGPLHCHIWQGAITNGYPVVRVNGKVHQVRRYLYEREKRPLLPGEIVEMSCDERLCVLVAHMHARPRVKLG